MSIISLQPFGDVDFSILCYLREELSKKLSAECRIGKRVNLPEKAFDPSRKQYRSTMFLDQLKTLLPGKALKGLAVVDVDLYVPRLNFVFGEAEVEGKHAVISLFRLHPQYYGQPQDIEIYQKRILKEAVHELGHTFGLGHCSDPRCVMHFSNSIEDTDRKRESFCSNCLDYLVEESEEVKS